MNILKFTAIFLTTALLIINPLPARAEASETNNKQADSRPSVLIKTKSIMQSSKWLELDINIPVVSGLGNPMYQNQLNGIIESSAMKDKQSIEKQSEEFRLKAEREGWEPRAFSLTIGYSLKADTDDLISYTVTTYAFTGGTGNPRVDCYNIKKLESRALSLKDFFKIGVDYISIINNEITGQIEKRLEEIPGSYFSDGKGFKSINPAQGFYIEDGDLVICFPKYSIAPGYTGNPEFRIPFEFFGSLVSDTSLFARPFGVLAVEAQTSVGSFSENIRVPVVHGLKNKEYQQRLNRIIMDNAYMDRQSSRARSFERKTLNREDIPFELKIDYTLEPENGGYLLRVNTHINTANDTDTAERTDSYRINPEANIGEAFDWKNIPLLIGSQEAYAHSSYACLNSRNTLMLPLIKTVGNLGYYTEYDEESERAWIVSEDGTSFSVSLYSSVGTFSESIVLSQSGPYLRDGVLYMPSGYFSSVLGIEVILEQNGHVTLNKK